MKGWPWLYVTASTVSQLQALDLIVKWLKWTNLLLPGSYVVNRDWCNTFRWEDKGEPGTVKALALYL